jgi:Zn-dependent M28 family amino/carboxypeptidase
VSQPFEVHGRTVRNLEVTVEPAGDGAQARSIVIGAHYDSAGTAPGANDNGTGTAAVIELARLLKGAALGRRLRLVLFVNEEPPYFQTPDMGSLRYADALVGRGEDVEAMLSLETLGSFSDERGSQSYPWPLSAFFPDTANFVAFVGMPASRSLVRSAIGSFRSHTAFPSVGGVAPAAIPGIDWSDHWSFARRGIPALMVTDTAIFRYAHYHQPSDTPDKVDYDRLARIAKGLERMIREMAR